MSIRAIFTPDYVRHEGVRPANIYLLRLLYLLMLVFVGSEAWIAIATHQGPWDHVRAVALCVWATYSTLSLLGLIHPLRMLPLVLFMIGYKVLWLMLVALPLWRAGVLAGSPAAQMTYAFLWVPLPIIAVPWKYVWRQYVAWPRARVAT